MFFVISAHAINAVDGETLSLAKNGDRYHGRGCEYKTHGSLLFIDV
jgi:hypothetical protein